MIDTNILLLLLIGSFRPGLVGVHKNCREFDLIDFDLLYGLVAKYDELLYLPNILTEVSNLLRQTKEPDRSQLTAHIASLFGCGKEDYASSDAASRHAHFTRLGLTDCAMLQADPDATLLTKDLDLYVEATRGGRSAINFLYYRESISPRV